MMASKPLPNLTNEEKILLNLRSLSQHFESFEVPARMTQEGMALYLKAQRPNITRSLKSLMKKGAVSERMSHVVGHRRRKKVYLLTPSGLLQAQGLEASLKEHLGAAAPKGIAVLEALLEGAEGPAKAGPPAHPAQALPPKIPSAPFFGREKELDAMVGWLRDPRSGFLVVTGMAGIGKTTLAQAFARSSGRDAIWYRFYEANTLEGMLHETGMWLGSRNRHSLISILSSPSGQHPDLSAHAKALLGDLDGTGALLVLDDLHMASPRVLSFLTVLLGMLEEREHDLKVIVTSRTACKFYNRRDVKVRGRVTELALDGLDRNSSMALLKGRGVSEGDSEGLYNITKGHPLALELADPLDVAKPYRDALEFVREEIFLRTEPNERALVERMSVLRYPVPAGWFAQASAQGPELLESLMDRGMVKRTGDSFELHGLVREYARERLASEVAETYHDLAADYFEARAEDRLCLIEAAHHRILAGRPQEACLLLDPVIESLLRDGFFELSSIASELSKNAKDPFQTSLAEYALGRAWLELGDGAPALNHLKKAHDASGLLKDDTPTYLRARISAVMAAAYALGGQMTEAGSMLDEALMRSHAVKGTTPALNNAMAQARVGLARMFKAKGDMGKAMENYREAVKIYAMLDEPGSGALMRYELGAVLSGTGADEEAMAEYREGLRLAQAAQDDHLLVDLSLALGDVFSDLGRWEEARSCLEKGLSWAHGPDDLLKTSRHYMEIGAAEDGSGGREGFLDRVKAYFQRRQSARSKSVSRIYDRISALYLKREDWEQAARLHGQARDLFTASQDLPNLAKSLNNLGMALKQMKDLQGAAREYKAALDVLERTGDKRAQGITCYNLAVAYDAMGDMAQKGKFAKKAREAFEGLGLKQELKTLSDLE